MSDYDQDKKEGDQGWMHRIQESPRTVTVLLIILIAAAAIYAFSGDQPAPGEEPGDEQATDVMEEESDEAVMEEEEGMVEGDQQEEVQLPPAQRTDEGFVETAQAGEGITHLARRAASQYLVDNDAGYEVSKEHQVFIEDYIQNQLGTRGLALGEQMTISNELIAQAVEAAGQLTEDQLENLHQYASAIP